MELRKKILRRKSTFVFPDANLLTFFSPPMKSIE